MIVGTVRDQEAYEFLPDQIQACFSYMNAHDLEQMKKGSYPIEGEKLFVNIVEYTTKSKEQCAWESHRKYIDVHVMLYGEEKIHLNFIRDLNQKTFVEIEDFLPLEGKARSEVQLHPMDFIICFPEDGHMTGIQIEKPTPIKKAIFKVQIR